MLSNDGYGTPHSSPVKTRKLDRFPEITGVDNDEDDDDDDYYSLDDDGVSDVSEGSDLDATETFAVQERQDLERRRVLEAAGVIVSDPANHDRRISQHTDGVDGVAALGGLSGKRGSSIGDALPRKRTLTHEPLSCARHKELPPVPTMDFPEDSEVAGRTGTNARLSPISEMLSTSVQPIHLKTTSDSSSTSRVDDAFERYETYKKRHGGQSLAANRMSASSFDTASSLAFSSPPRSPATSLSPSLRDREQERGAESRTSQFLSFLGRHTRSSTPDIDRERKIPIISGPIHTSISNTAAVPGDPHNSMTRESSPAFGTSWASLLDRTALEGIPAVERKRQEAIFELISTEADYVRDLQLIVELFYSRLVDTLGEESTSVIFSNIEDILLTNTTFLSTLEERQRECRLYIDHVGDLLETHMPHMRVYLDYCVNQANGGKVLQSLRDTNPELSTQLQCLREDSAARNLDLSSYLLVPMQRLTRYPLLIRQILQYTDPPNPTSNVSSAPRLTLSLPTEHAECESIANSLACAERILEEVNETIRDRESRARLSEVSQELRIGKDRLDLTLPTHHLGLRKLLKEGVLMKAKSGRKLRVLLCSDILLLLNESEGGGLYRVPLPVHELEIQTSRNHARSENAYIRIHRAYPRGGETLVLRAPSIREARAWTEAITLAAAKAKEGIRMAVGDSRDTKLGLCPAIVGVGMGHVAGAGTPRASADVGVGCNGVTPAS
ncbi:Dbl homology domain-containing protein [Pisolithus thermaeus]|nr:Dbl homology domain-containing protein [Pisolithus croceorrhizus]KAI6156348.1 Dbl homology domain-containing protein [Pisolithus thermaeus]